MNTHTKEPWISARYSKPDGTPHESSADVAETLKFSAMHSDRAELFGASADNYGDEVVVFYTGNGPKAHLNAQRAVECVNALENLRPSGIAGAVEALEQIAKLYENPEPPSMHELGQRAYDMRCIARTALANLKMEDAQ